MALAAPTREKEGSGNWSAHLTCSTPVRLPFDKEEATAGKISLCG